MTRATEPFDVPASSPEPRLPTRGVRWRWTDVALAGLAAEVPPVSRTTAEVEERLAPLYKRLGLKAGWVEAVTGIGARRLWAPGERYLDGAVRAARRALSDAGVSPGAVQVVVSCSVYKDRLEPSLACEVQGALGIGASCTSFDVSNACLGFLTGATLVANMVSLGQIEAGLVVSAEDAGPVLEATIATLISPSADIHAFRGNLATLTLGSAATAAVITRGRGAATLHGGATLSATDQRDLCVGDARGMHTDAVRLLREGVALAARTWAETSETLGWEPGQVSAYAMHQVGKAHHDAIVRQLGLPPHAAPQIYPWMGNIGSCGVPVTAALARDQGLIRPGERAVWMGIGSGLNCMMLGVS